jgi:hypothetical protein
MLDTGSLIFQHKVAKITKETVPSQNLASNDFYLLLRALRDLLFNSQFPIPNSIDPDHPVENPDPSGSIIVF